MMWYKNIKYFIKRYFILIAVILLSACNEMTLYKNLEEKEANLMTAVLLRENIDTQRMLNPDGTYDLILTDKTYFPEAMDVLAMRGFPRKTYDSLCTIFKGEGMVSTPLEQRARYTCAKAQELSGSLMELDGIIMARVHLVLSETDAISRKVKPASASVMIKYKEGMDVDTLIPRIKQMVSFGVESLPYQNVSVMLSEEKVNQENNIHAVGVKLSEEEIAENKSNPSVKHNPFEVAPSSNMFLYLFMGIMFIVMVAFGVFIMRVTTASATSGTTIDNPENLPTEF